MKTLTNSELDTEISTLLQEGINELADLELIDIEIARLSINLDLNESIAQQDELFDRAAKNLNLDYLIEV